MNLARWAFDLRRRRFHNQELIFQSLYKAQNLGFYPNIYEGDLIDRYSESVVKADSFAGAGSFKRALCTLGTDLRHWDSAGLGRLNEGRVILAAPSNLAALALVAEAHVLGWRLVVEECPFTQRFMRPVARRDGRRIEFHPFSLIARQVRANASAPGRAVVLYVTFPDRPFDSIRGSVAVRLLGRNYLLSIAEALLTRAPVDFVFRFARSLVPVDHPTGGASAISGEEVGRLTQEQAGALEVAILASPLEYLGWESLYSRSQLYFDLVRANRRSFFQCLLRHAQLNGMALPPGSYAGLVELLSRRENRP